MSESVVARLRDRLNRYTPREWSSPFTPVEDATLAALLDIAEAVAMWDVPPPDIEAGVGFCFYCAGEGRSHAPDCPYRRARELCGKEQDGAE